MSERIFFFSIFQTQRSGQTHGIIHENTQSIALFLFVLPRLSIDDAPLDNGYVSAASGHGSAFEESLKDDSDHESVFSATSPGSAERIAADSNTKDTALDLPGSFGPTVVTNTIKNKDSINFPVDAIFPTVAHEEQDMALIKDQQGSRSSRRKSGTMFLLNFIYHDLCCI